MLSNTMVEQEDLLALALAAEVNVQVEDDLLVRSETPRRSGSRGDHADSQGGQDEMLKVRWHFPSNGLVLFNKR